MGFLEGSKAVSTSIGGSRQTINFTPVINARGATSGGTIGGVSQTDTPTVTTSQGAGSDNPNDPALTRTGLIPALSLDSSRPIEAISSGNPNYLSQSDRSFAPGTLPSPSTEPMANAIPWLPIVLLGALALYLTR